MTGLHQASKRIRLRGLRCSSGLHRIGHYDLDRDVARSTVGSWQKQQSSPTNRFTRDALPSPAGRLFTAADLAAMRLLVWNGRDRFDRFDRSSTEYRCRTKVSLSRSEAGPLLFAGCTTVRVAAAESGNALLGCLATARS